jgi:hypothetical protein
MMDEKMTDQVDSELDYSRVRAFLNRKWARERNIRKRLWKQARKDAAQIIDMIVRVYGPERIYQWGSVLEASEFQSISDIDIAVEGSCSIHYKKIPWRSRIHPPFSSINKKSTSACNDKSLSSGDPPGLLLSLLS